MGQCGVFTLPHFYIMMILRFVSIAKILLKLACFFKKIVYIGFSFQG